MEYARSKGIPVTNTPEVLNDDVADLAIALMIMTARRLVVTDRYVRSGRWPKEGEYPLAQKASGKRVGILGMGRIGKEIAKRAEAMNNSIAYHSRRPVADVSYKHYPDLVELARNSDFLIVIIPSTPQRSTPPLSFGTFTQIQVWGFVQSNSLTMPVIVVCLVESNGAVE